jgi:hypothetical protein
VSIMAKPSHRDQVLNSLRVKPGTAYEIARRTGLTSKQVKRVLSELIVRTPSPIFAVGSAAGGTMRTTVWKLRKPQRIRPVDRHARQIAREKKAAGVT